MVGRTPQTLADVLLKIDASVADARSAATSHQSSDLPPENADLTRRSDARATPEAAVQQDALSDAVDRFRESGDGIAVSTQTNIDAGVPLTQLGFGDTRESAARVKESHKKARGLKPLVIGALIAIGVAAGWLVLSPG